MKAILSPLFFLLVMHGTCQAQFYDRAWLVGLYGDIKLSYLNNMPDTSLFYTNTQQILFLTNGSNVSDTDANVLFLSNGAQVGGPSGLLMDNGNGIMDSLLTLSYPQGFSTKNSTIILPKGGNQFYLFNLSETDSVYNIHGLVQPVRLYYAVIDMNQDGGMGKVISKKNLIWDNIPLDDTRFTACRHANGRDWWLVVHEFETDAYLTYLVTSDTIYPPLIQHIGPSDIQGDIGQSVFSPDGSFFATAMWTCPIVMLGFDRCSGIFSYIDTISLPSDSIFSNGQLQTGCDAHTGIGCSFSPNGRFLYVSSQCYLMQYDMQADTIPASGVQVARVDTTEYPTPLFNTSFLMPNAQIVMSSYRYGPPNFHLVQYPDVKAPNCGFQYYGLVTNSIAATSLPNMVNYRLGALVGSGCDTLTGINKLSASTCAIKVYPNPASDHIIIGLSTYLKDAQLYIYDALGSMVYHTPMYLDADLDVSGFANGVYLVRVLSKDGDVSGKFVKE